MKVPKVFFSHISLIVVIISLILFPEFPNTLQSRLERFKESVVSLAVWINRKESNFPYNPNKDITLQTKLRRQQKKKPKSWQTIVEEYLIMCKKAIMGEAVKHSDNRNEGLEDNSFSIFNLDILSIGAGIRILIIHIILYKIIRHSNVKSWSKLFSCIFPCC